MKRKTLYSLLTSHKKNIFFGIIGLTMVDMMQLLVPILVGKVIDILASSKTDSFLLSDLNKYAFYLIICGVVMAIFRFVWRFFLLGTSRKIEKNETLTFLYAPTFRDYKIQNGSVFFPFTENRVKF